MRGHEDSHKYDRILRMEHPVSERHPRMSALERAAQFSPFAALTGYDAAIQETARQTARRIELDEAEKEQLDRRLQLVQSQLDGHPEITVTYFLPDEQKAGGQYRTVTGKIRKISGYEGVLVMEDGSRIPVNEVIGLEFNGAAW